MNALATSQFDDKPQSEPRCAAHGLMRCPLCSPAPAKKALIPVGVKMPDLSAIAKAEPKSVPAETATVRMRVNLPRQIVEQQPTATTLAAGPTAADDEMLSPAESRPKRRRKRRSEFRPEPQIVEASAPENALVTKDP